ncbi:DUF4198 domain-containing protein [soil metagenome]
MRNMRALLTAAGASALIVAAAAGHDFWLIPDAFQLSPGETLQVRGQTSSSFPSSESAVAVDRIAEAVIIDSRGRARIAEVTTASTALLLRHRPDAVGQYLVSTVIHPRSVRESAESFRRYLVLEGAPEILERLEREGAFPRDSITRRYAKYAKTVVEVGHGGRRSYGQVVGHPLEFLPMADPEATRSGDTLRVQLLLDGRPLVNANAHMGSVVRPQGMSLDDLAGTERHLVLRTDSNGIIELVIDRDGIWNVRALHLEPAAAGSGADWETHWATLVFRVSSTPPGA